MDAYNYEMTITAYYNREMPNEFMNQSLTEVASNYINKIL